MSEAATALSAPLDLSAASMFEHNENMFHINCLVHFAQLQPADKLAIFLLTNTATFYIF
jgi:hypothetical protein